MTDTPETDTPENTPETNSPAPDLAASDRPAAPSTEFVAQQPPQDDDTPRLAQRSLATRSHGRIAVRPSTRPQELMRDTPDLAGVWQAQVLTLFPSAFPGVLGESLTGKALKEGLWQLNTFDLRRHGVGRHRNVDDTPAGGGAGMVLRPDVLGAAIEEARAGLRGNHPLIYLSPRGRRMDQKMMQTFARCDGLTLLCGRFEGIDERVIEHYGIQEVSLGDFVMTGGELAAQALIDATVRLLPGVLGNQASTEEESFSSGLLEHPQYTRPASWQGRDIPEVLMSGHHGRIAQWRQDMSEALTRARRPDLWETWNARRDEQQNARKNSARGKPDTRD